jgi:hypothetical protein
MNCTKAKNTLPDLLLNPEQLSPQVRAHIKECAGCRQELSELEATMALMDAWQAPEPNPYWHTRMQARLREEQEAAPAGFFERLRARLVYGTNFKLRPVAVTALSVILIVGGGVAYVVVPNAPPQPSAAIHSLQTLDHNAQLFDQLEEMGQDEGD